MSPARAEGQSFSSQTTALPNRQASNYGRTERDVLYDVMVYAGQISASSFDFDEHELDWALCSFDRRYLPEAAEQTLNTIPPAHPLLRDEIVVSTVADKMVPGREVLVKTALQTPRVGVILGAPYFYKAPNSRKFIEVVQLDMRSDLGEFCRFQYLQIPTIG